MLGRHTPVSSDARPPDPAIADKVAWAVEAAARCVPAATCLTQALAVQVLLARRGVPARLHIGVAKDEKRQLLAHAWVESEGRVIIGGCVAVSYTTLAVLEGENG